MPTESILFAPEIDKRELDKQTDEVNDQLAGVGEDIPVNFDGDTDGLAPAGGGGMGGLGGAGAAGGAAGLASKIPKPVAGVTASAALPMALVGGVGLGMLSAMRSASARLQTSNKLFGIAVDNFFREPGNILDQMIVRPLVDSFMDLSIEWDEGLRRFSDTLGEGIIPDSFESAGDRLRGVGEALQAIPLTWIETLGRGLEGLGKRVQDLSIPKFQWPDVKAMWPGWPDIKMPEFPAMPDAPEFPEMPSAPSFPSMPSAPEFPAMPSAPKFPEMPDAPEFPDLPNWSNLRPRMPDWSGISLDLPDWLDRWTDGDGNGNNTVTPGGDIGGVDPGGGGQTIPTIGGDRNSSGGDGGAGRGGTGSQTKNELVAMASGGFVGQSGAAMLHKNERVLPSSQVSDRGEASFDPSSVADGFDNSAVARDLSSKLDRLHGDLQELSKAVDMRVEIGGEAVARASADGTRNRVGDTDPTI